MLPGLSEWSLSRVREPMIRVGVVLPSDEQHELRVRVPDAPYRIETGAGASVARQSELTLRAVGGRVEVVGASPAPGASDLVRLVPEADLPLGRGEGLLLSQIVTGRGFHWQKRIDVTFVGRFEVRAVGGNLVAVNVLPLEEYLAGVIAAEMSGECPLEFLRSQCIVARSWVLVHSEDKHSELAIDRCNDDCCQRYQGTVDITPTVVEAVRSTRGQVIMDETAHHIIDANYSKSCGGIIESPEHVWNIRKVGQRPALDAPADSAARRFFPFSDKLLHEYLTGDWLGTTDIFCSPTVVPEKDLPRYLGKVDDGGGHFRWCVSYARDQLEEVLARKLFSRQPADPLGELTGLTVVARGDSGRAKQLRIDYLDKGGHPRCVDIHTEYNIRDALHPSFLFSSAFVVDIGRDAGGRVLQVTLTGAGWGHGAGLCQIGALGMALRGYSADAILHHYFSPILLHSCY